MLHNLKNTFNDILMQTLYDEVSEKVKPDNKEYKALKTKAFELTNVMKKQLTSTQYRMLEELMDTHIQIITLCEKELFIQTFRQGMRLILEAIL